MEPAHKYGASSPWLDLAREIVDLTVTSALGLSTAHAIWTGRVSEATVGVLLVAFRGLAAWRQRPR